MLRIEHFTKSYGKGKPAVSDLNLHVAPGDIFAFIGPNGAGKTTTLRAVAGIHDFEGGDILINGVSIKADPLACKKVMRYIPDNPDLYSYLTGIQYLNFLADIYGLDPAVRAERIQKHGDAFGITHRLNDMVGSFSHGMKQKLALIGALMDEPKLLLLDEPFVGLDPKAAFTLKQHMREMTENGAAIFFSTHVLEVAEKLCNKVAIINHGQLVAQGDMDTVKGDDSLEELFMELVEKE
ncbi:MAG: ABC transporter ATP-binding protein [Clostridia bacterium]|nr:ABC transporter ATP-binding protein [Clostridia bacterium]MBQ6359309.1 ABC transporter ATP-binding protein [Clostridia bacterium]MBQ6866937.1 ABC transporter ATP-binding protein [Clostridia bacterium]MBQ6891361.1 ABC transporter ATP-binding protein [Clostridia bacterium]MBQ9322808.1 ABC transporter ATP-binding protein [Clostridia bacterium]